MKRSVRSLNHLVDGVFVLLMLFLLLCSIYIKMDSDSVYQAADPRQWVQYKPEFPEEVETFEDLQKKNPDVVGWLTVYGSTIDYPILYSDQDNNYYLNHNALKEPESSGSIFLDYRNHPDFTDFNNILHGHHMARHKMFGDLDRFADEKYFQEHEFGNVFFDGKDHSFQIIATILTDGYDGNIYKTGIKTEAEKVKFINYVYLKAKLIRGVDLTNKTAAERERTLLTQGVTSPLTPGDTLLTFSTCNLNETNGRYIVVAKLLDHLVENPFPETEMRKGNNERIDTFTLFNRYGALPLYVWFAILLLLILLTYIFYRVSRRRDRRIAHEKAKANDNP
ncbi:MAG: class B sortase [Clostridia bacterium]|nr:class B sortase [Clostridia bacterium]